jgi:putative oxidoreductase
MRELAAERAPRREIHHVKRLDSLQPVSLLLLRLTLGLIFFTYGYPKLAHPGPAMHGFFVQHGLPGWFVSVAGILEVFGGILVALGLFTRPAALLLAMEMGVALWKVHSAKGYLAVHEYEFPLALAAACLALATIGAGLLSFDHLLFGGKSRSTRAGNS